MYFLPVGCNDSYLWPLLSSYTEWVGHTQIIAGHDIVSVFTSLIILELYFEIFSVVQVLSLSVSSDQQDNDCAACNVSLHVSSLCLPGTTEDPFNVLL